MPLFMHYRQTVIALISSPLKQFIINKIVYWGELLRAAELPYKPWRWPHNREVDYQEACASASLSEATSRIGGVTQFMISRYSLPAFLYSSSCWLLHWSKCQHDDAPSSYRQMHVLNLQAMSTPDAFISQKHIISIGLRTARDDIMAAYVMNVAWPQYTWGLWYIGYGRILVMAKKA